MLIDHHNNGNATRNMPSETINLKQVQVSWMSCSRLLNACMRSTAHFSVVTLCTSIAEIKFWGVLVSGLLKLAKMAATYDNI